MGSFFFSLIQESNKSRVGLERIVLMTPCRREKLSSLITKQFEKETIIYILHFYFFLKYFCTNTSVPTLLFALFFNIILARLPLLVLMVLVPTYLFQKECLQTLWINSLRVFIFIFVVSFLPTWTETNVVFITFK